MWTFRYDWNVIYINNINILLMDAIINTKISKYLIPDWGATCDPYFEPINPPINTAKTNGMRVSKSISSCPDTPAPINPEIEFNRINREAVAAAFFGVAQPFRRRIGERKIPPPTPTKPLTKPIAPPIGYATAFFGITLTSTTLSLV